MIEINNLTTSPADEEFLKKVAKNVLKGECPSYRRIPGKVNLSIALVGQGRIRQLNKKYLGRNRVTDVLAFGQNQKFPIFPRSELTLGEIVICLREVKKNTKRYKSNFKKELVQVLIHGILHLLGYEHEKGEREAERMRRKEEQYLSQVKFST